MAEIVNLRRARKAKARTAARAQADANRIEHGAAKSQRRLAEAAREKLKRETDGKKLDSVD